MSRDYLDHRGARILADKIYEYWQRRGYCIAVRVVGTVNVHRALTLGTKYYSVRSNLKGGLPQEVFAARELTGT